MSTKRFYQIALTSPLWLPVLLFPLLYFLPSLATSGFILLYSILIGGLPYMVFLVTTLVFFQKKNGRQLRHATFWFPLVFAMLFYSLVLAWLWLRGELSEWPSDIGVFIPLLLLIGYGYVIVTDFVYRLLRRCGIIREDQFAKPPFITLNL